MVPIFHRYRLPTSEIGRVWHGGGAGANKEKAVASMDEDTTTMAVESARIALEMAALKESEIGADLRWNRVKGVRRKTYEHDCGASSRMSQHTRG